MGENSGIAWTTHTFNPWVGCEKVSPACTRCYAETFDARFGGGHWGPGSTRRVTSAANWRKPIHWNKSADARGVRERVFCASLADVFEDRPELVKHRARLFQLIAQTPNLDWLLLTKRPENLPAMLPWTRGYSKEAIHTSTTGYEAGASRSPTPMWSNVWLGTTVENQEYAELRVPQLLAVAAMVHFLSAEPILGPIDLTRLKDDEVGATWNALQPAEGGVDWVITGCESGSGKRRADVSWYRSLRDQCAAHGRSFFLKQADDSNATSGLVTLGKDSWLKNGGIIEQPYLDGTQHTAVPIPGFRTIDSL